MGKDLILQSLIAQCGYCDLHGIARVALRVTPVKYPSSMQGLGISRSRSTTGSSGPSDLARPFRPLRLPDHRILGSCGIRICGNQGRVGARPLGPPKPWKSKGPAPVGKPPGIVVTHPTDWLPVFARWSRISRAFKQGPKVPAEPTRRGEDRHHGVGRSAEASIKPRGLSSDRSWHGPAVASSQPMLPELRPKTGSCPWGIPRSSLDPIRKSEMRGKRLNPISVHMLISVHG